MMHYLKIMNHNCCQCKCTPLNKLYLYYEKERKKRDVQYLSIWLLCGKKIWVLQIQTPKMFRKGTCLWYSKSLSLSIPMEMKRFYCRVHVCVLCRWDARWVRVHHWIKRLLKLKVFLWVRREWIKDPGGSCHRCPLFSFFHPFLHNN